MNDKLSDIHFDEAVSQRKLFLESKYNRNGCKDQILQRFYIISMAFLSFQCRISLVVRSKERQLYSQANEDWNRLLH